MKQAEFQITKGEMVISDPCYELGTWCQGTADVLNGTWVAIPIYFDGRVARLVAYHKETIANNPAELQRLLDMDFDDELPFEFGVDSGQLGFFDKSTYRDDASVKDLESYDFGDSFDEEDGDLWYRVVTNQTIEMVDGKYKNFGVIPNGCVSSSGWGDGSYSVYTNVIDGIVFGLVAEFILVDGEVCETETQFVLNGVEPDYDED